MRNPLILSVLLGCALSGRAHAQTATIEFPVLTLRVTETNAVISVAVGRAGNLMSAATVDYSTTDVLATAGLDYVGTNGTLSFAAGQTNQIITILILNDALREGSETFLVELTNPGPGATLGTRTVAVVNLSDNDTGIEFVDIKQHEWNINHWVRGGCLYGVMPCNGLTYAPPHDCARPGDRILVHLIRTPQSGCGRLNSLVSSLSLLRADC